MNWLLLFIHVSCFTILDLAFFFGSSLFLSFHSKNAQNFEQDIFWRLFASTLRLRRSALFFHCSAVGCGSHVSKRFCFHLLCAIDGALCTQSANTLFSIFVFPFPLSVSITCDYYWVNESCLESSVKRHLDASGERSKKNGSEKDI